MIPPRFQQVVPRFYQNSSGFVVCLVFGSNNGKGVGVKLLSDCLWFSGTKLHQYAVGTIQILQLPYIPKFPILRLDQYK